MVPYQTFIINGLGHASELELHYDQFWEILSQNWGMKFCSYDFIFILFLNILASKAQKKV